MKTQIIDIIANAVNLDTETVANLIEIQPKADMGDYAFPCFQLAKTLRKAPPMIAADIAEAIGECDIVDKLEVKGAYLNFFLKKEIFVKSNFVETTSYKSKVLLLNTTSK